jgi:hypothetical protein
LLRFVVATGAKQCQRGKCRWFSSVWIANVVAARHCSQAVQCVVEPGCLLSCRQEIPLRSFNSLHFNISDQTVLNCMPIIPILPMANARKHINRLLCNSFDLSPSIVTPGIHKSFRRRKRFLKLLDLTFRQGDISFIAQAGAIEQSKASAGDTAFGLW